VNLGDCLYGPLEPAETADVLMALGIPTVCGNEDRILFQNSSGTSPSPTRAFTLSRLSPAHVAWLRALPATLVAGNVYLCHGTPRSDTQYLLHDSTGDGVALRTLSGIHRELDGITCPLILCGHDHIQQRIRLPDGRLIVNPGSVGLPAYRDDDPPAHVMEAGSPHARYSIVTGGTGEWNVEEISVGYDWDAASDRARRNGRPDWAAWLRTGRAT